MLAEVATPADWARVRADEDSIGYTLISPPINWQPTEQELADAANKPTNSALGRQFNEIAKQLAATDAQVNQITQPNHQEPLSTRLIRSAGIQIFLIASFRGPRA